MAVVLKFEDNEPVDLIQVPVTLTADWQDLGKAMVTKDFDLFSLWFDLDINDSVDVQVRAVAYPTLDLADAYVFPIQTVLGSKVEVQEQYFELSLDVDQKIIIPLSISDLTPFVKIQVKAGTVGASAGQVLTAKVTAKQGGI